MKLNIGKLIKKASGVALRTVAPGVAGLLDEMKLPADTTGEQLDAAIQDLPADQRAAILDRQLDVEETLIRETGETLRAMHAADAVTPHSTRPFIALMMSWSVVVSSAIILAIWAYGVVVKDDALVTSVVNGWPMVLALLGIPGALLRAYFGILGHEHGNKLAAAQGHPVQPLGGLLRAAGKLINK